MLDPVSEDQVTPDLEREKFFKEETGEEYTEGSSMQKELRSIIDLKVKPLLLDYLKIYLPYETRDYHIGVICTALLNYMNEKFSKFESECIVGNLTHAKPVIKRVREIRNELNHGTWEGWINKTKARRTNYY